MKYSFVLCIFLIIQSASVTFGQVAFVIVESVIVYIYKNI